MSQKAENSFKWSTWRQAAAKLFGEKSWNFSGMYIDTRAIKGDHPRPSRPNRSHARARQSSKSQNLSALWSPKWKFRRKFRKIQISHLQRSSRIHKNVIWQYLTSQIQWWCPWARSYNGFGVKKRKIQSSAHSVPQTANSGIISKNSAILGYKEA